MNAIVQHKKATLQVNTHVLVVNDLTSISSHIRHMYGSLMEVLGTICLSKILTVA